MQSCWDGGQYQDVLKGQTHWDTCLTKWRKNIGLEAGILSLLETIIFFFYFFFHIFWPLLVGGIDKAEQSLLLRPCAHHFLFLLFLFLLNLFSRPIMSLLGCGTTEFVSSLLFVPLGDDISVSLHFIWTQTSNSHPLRSLPSYPHIYFQRDVIFFLNFLHIIPYY